MAIFPGDVRIKNCLELGLDDLRKNNWLVDDIFSDFINDPDLAKKYGQKEIQNAKDYLLNNKIPVIMGLRLDKEEVPCITIQIAPSIEADDLATIGDLSTEVEEYSPDEIGKPIKFIIPTFKIKSYVKSTGVITVENADLRYLSVGMVAVDPDTGNAYPVIEKLDDVSFKIEAGTTIGCTKLAIIPHYSIYKARRERATFRETYNIGCHSHGDPSTLIFLHSMVVYVLLRYREGLLEAKGFDISSISSSDMMKNQAFESIQENVYSRFITLKGQTDFTWVKTPMRTIEVVDSFDASPDSIDGAGIKIISNKKTIEYDVEDPLWVTIEDEE